MDNKDEKQPPVAGAWEVRGVRLKRSPRPNGEMGLKFQAKVYAWSISPARS